MDARKDVRARTLSRIRLEPPSRQERQGILGGRKLVGRSTNAHECTRIVMRLDGLRRKPEERVPPQGRRSGGARHGRTEGVVDPDRPIKLPASSASRSLLQLNPLSPMPRPRRSARRAAARRAPSPRARFSSITSDRFTIRVHSWIVSARQQLPAPCGHVRSQHSLGARWVRRVHKSVGRCRRMLPSTPHLGNSDVVHGGGLEGHNRLPRASTEERRARSEERATTRSPFAPRPSAVRVDATRD